jgi:ribosomal protein S18 acetylase RimI-like enzyme
MVEIVKAGVADAGEILTVQRAAYVTEAQLYGTPSFSALSEPLDGVRAAIEAEQVLVARLGTRVVGAVRGVCDGRDCEVTRLVVAPDMRRRGIGAELIDAVERTAPAEIRRFWLHTGDRSAANLRLYQKAGYTVTHTRQVSDSLSLVYLEKLVAVR